MSVKLQKKIADSRNGDPVAIQKTQDVQPEEPGEGELIHKGGKWLCIKDEDGPEEVTKEKHFILKELTDILRDTKCFRDENLKANPHSEKSMIICQDKEKMLVPYYKFHIKRTNTVQTN